MWQHLLLMWEDRNNDQHGRDNIEQVGKEQEKLLQKIDQLYTQKESIDPEDRRLYHKPVDTWKEETNKKIREWINLAELLTKKIMKNHKKNRSKATPDWKLLRSTASRNSTKKHTYVHT